MPGLRTSLALSALLAVPGAAGVAGTAAAQRVEAPRTVSRHATLAVEGDSVPRVRSRWEARLRRDSTDRVALLGLATLARLEYDYPTAERLSRRLFATDSTAADGYAIQARLGFAEGFDLRSFNNDAYSQFTRAREEARAAGDRTAEGEALLRLTFIRGRLRGVAVAEATLDSASRLIPETALALRARILDRRAILYILRGRADAQAEAEAAIAMARRAGDLRTEADAFVTLGKIIQYRAAFDSALVVLRRAEDLYRRARSRSALAGSLIWQAQVLSGTGRFGEMREVMRRALADGEATHNPGPVGDAYRAFGVLGIMMGDFSAAAENLKKAAAISRETGDSSGLRTTQSFLADVMLAGGDADGARNLVLGLLARSTEPRYEFQLRSKLAAIAIHQRDWTGAERAIAEARAVLPTLPTGTGTAWLLHDEGRLALARGDLAAAERLIRQWLEVNSGASEDQMRYDAHLRLADIAIRRNEVDRAEREITLASDELDHWRARLSDAELRVLAYQLSPMQHAAASEGAERDARVARVLGGLAAGGRAEVAFALAERRRARELRDRLVRATALRAENGRAPAPAPAPVERAGRSMNAAELAAALPDDRTALLEFVAGGRGAPTTVFAVQRSGLRAYRIPPTDSLGEMIVRLAALLEHGGNPESLARLLGSALLGPVVADLDARVSRLVIVPDGPLHFVPWDVLRLPDGRQAVEQYAVSVAPSAAVVAALWRRATPGRAFDAQATRLLAFGDPAFARSGASSPGAAAEVYRSAFDSIGGLARLKGSADEARLVARYAPRSEVLLGERASAAFLKQAPLDSFQVIHFATHALVDQRSDTRTALALSPSEGESGFVGPGDLAALELTADLVVLSACRTAGGRLVGGEGMQGLTAPLLQAGARSVVATHWRIGDRTTRAFVGAFYAALAGGLPVSDALRAAKLDAIRRGAPPREWAAFTTVGDPLVVVPLQIPPPGDHRWLTGALVALTLAGIGAFAYRRRAGLRQSSTPAK